MTDGDWPTYGPSFVRGSYATADDVPHVLNAIDRNSAIIEMVSTGGFADTPALARWAETDEAQPILREFLMARIRPAETECFAIDLDAAHREIEAQDALAADIEARFSR